MRQTLIIVLILTAFHASAQSFFTAGTIVTSGGEQIKGFINNKKSSELHLQVRFKKSLEDNEVAYTTEDLSEFWLEEGGWYKQYAFGDKRYFFEVIVGGKLELLYMNADNLSAYFVHTTKVEELKNSRVRVENEGTSYYKYKKEYTGLLKIAMQGYPEIFPSVDQTALEKKALIRLFKKYHEGIHAEYEVYNEIRSKTTFGFYIGPNFGSVVIDAKDPGYQFLEQDLFTSPVTYVLGIQLTQSNLFGLTPRIEARLGLAYRKNTYESRRIVIKQGSLMIPVNLNYKLVDKSLDFFVTAGLNPVFSLSSNYETERDRDKLVADAFGPISVAGNIGLGVSKEVGDNVVFLLLEYERGNSFLSNPNRYLNSISSHNRQLAIKLGMNL